MIYESVGTDVDMFSSKGHERREEITRKEGVLICRVSFHLPSVFKIFLQSVAETP